MEDVFEPEDPNNLNDNEFEEIAGMVEEGENENENQPFDENDSNSDDRFPEVDETSWIQWFCAKDENQFFVEIDEDFIKHKMNLIGINCNEYLDIILSQGGTNDDTIDEEHAEKMQKIRDCYGQIHKRFIHTPKGLALVREKYLNGVYGHCPRVMCEKQILLPIGLSEDSKFSRVKVFCPLCEEVYKSKHNDIDGAYFGTTFPQFFLTSYPDLNPRLQIYKEFVPKLFGFKIFGKKGSKYYCKDKKELYEKMKKLNISLDY